MGKPGHSVPFVPSMTLTGLVEVFKQELAVLLSWQVGTCVAGPGVRGLGGSKQGPKVDIAGHDNLVSGQPSEEGSRQAHLERILPGLMLEAVAGSTRQLLGASDFKHKCDL